MNRVKKFITGIIFLMMFTVSLNVFAEDISVTLNGNNIVFEDAKPIIYNDRTLIPIRAVFEKANCYVDWDSKNNMAVIGNEEKVIFISINGEKMKVYDIVKDEENEIDLDVPAMIVDESTMIPLRAVGEALGAKVEWNQQSNTVSLNI